MSDKYKVGDRVICENFMGDHAKATVARTPSETLDNLYHVKRDDRRTGGGDFVPGYGTLWRIRESEIKLISSEHTMTPFQSGKDAHELDIDKTAQFVVVKEDSSFKVGDTLKLDEDDGTSCPYFKRVSDGEVHCVSWSSLAYAEEYGSFRVGTLVKKEGDRREFIVLAAIGTVRVIGYKPEGQTYMKAMDNTTVSELKAVGYFDPAQKALEVTEVTMDEVEAKFGKKVKIKNADSK